MSLKAACGLVLVLLSVRVMHAGKNLRVIYYPSKICAVKGSTVFLHCYVEPRQEVIWVVGSGAADLRSERKYSGRVRSYYNNDDYNGRTTTVEMSDLRESDSAEYKCRITTQQEDVESTGSPGVSLSVTDLQVKVKKTSSYNRKTLECVSSCSPSSYYIWYRNGQKIPQETRSQYNLKYWDRSSYSCAVEGQEKFASPPVCVDGPERCYKVTYDVRNICATEGSSVDISCSYSSYYSIITKLWFSGGEQWTSSSAAGSQGRVQVLDTEQRLSILRITDLRKSDSAEYHFKFQAASLIWGSDLPGTTLTVTALQIKVITATKGQSGVEVELKCHSSCSPASHPTFVWFKSGRRLEGAQTSTFKGWISPGEDVSCSLAGHEHLHSPPLYSPTPPIVSVAPSVVLEEGSSLTLTCSTDANPEAIYAWYKESDRGNELSEQTKQLVFSSIQPSDSGSYYCRAENQLGSKRSNSTLVNVTYAPKTASLSVSPSAKVDEGSLVTLNCSSDANPATYIWYKDNQTVSEGALTIYVINWMSLKDGGNYHCKCVNQHGEKTSTHVHVNVQYAPRTPIVSLSSSDVVVEGSSLTMNCSSDANPKANYTWYKENEDSPRASGQSFTITDFRAEHSGYYYCVAQNMIGLVNSTSHLVVVAGFKTSVTVGPLVAVFLLFVLIAVFFLVRKVFSNQRAHQPVSSSQVQMSSVYDTEQDNICYTSVTFIKNQEDSLYSNIRPTKLELPRKNQDQIQDQDQDLDQEDDSSVEYSVVRVKNSSLLSAGDEADEDLSALYSTVRK